MFLWFDLGSMCSTMVAQYMPFLWIARSALCNQEDLFSNSIAGTAVTVIPRLTRIGKTSYTIQNKVRAPSAKLFVELKGLFLMVVRNFCLLNLQISRRYLLFVIDLILGSETSCPVPSCPIPIILTSSNFETRLRCARRGKCWPPSRRSWYSWILHWQKLSRWLAVPQRQWWKHRSHYMIYFCWIDIYVL